MDDSNNKILVHVCCAPCMSYVAQNLQERGFEPVFYFFNPNIQPEEEYEIRLNELINYCKIKEYSLITEKNEVSEWNNAIKGLENVPEGGARCRECFKIRLLKTGKKAKELKFKNFTTVLSVSPHKNSTVINQTGKELAEQIGINFLEENFKKNDGFKKTVELSQKYNMYRQTYCGCLYSRKTKI